MSTMVKVDNVTKCFNHEPILKNLNLEVSTGDICGIIGRNGSGKSVLFKIIAGLFLPSEGIVYVDEEEIQNGKFAKDMGVILDCTGFLPSYSAFENLKMIASINKKVNDREIKELIKKVGLDPDSKKSYRKFSTGMKQRLAFAQAMMEKPKLLLLDEPMNGLDKSGVELMRSLILEMNEKMGTTVLMTSHIKEDILTLCKTVYLLEDGKLKSGKNEL